eukprot:14204546-Alexandrium_andersonii.AAC.1
MRELVARCLTVEDLVSTEHSHHDHGVNQGPLRLTHPRRSGLIDEAEDPVDRDQASHPPEL